MKNFLDYFLHLDQKLELLIGEYGVYIYLILFLIIFVETGLVVMPFLPGDSLLFAAGSFAAVGYLNIWYLLILLFIAAVIGDTINYMLGQKIGLKVLHWKIGGKQLVKQKYIDQTHEFYEKHGSKAIILARFMPIVRTFAPFVAGIGEMNYKKFISFNLIGGAIWVVSLLFLGYFFGQIPIIKHNFEKVILLIIFLSILPMFIEIYKMRKK
ncbi:MAG: DedA family protein [Bacteroidetes bacterium]|nr:DedA family protein [Bacteroidota bacterium]